MKKITMFLMASCPYCRQALAWMDALYVENEAYKALEIEFVDEVVHPEIANTFDYYYVPSYYVDGEKRHEGAASLDIIRGVFDAAM